MKYKDLPSEKLVQKILATSFGPKKDREVADWAEQIVKHIRFLESQRIKLVQKFGESDEKGNCSVPREKLKDFLQEFEEVKNMEINEVISDCPIKRSWFSDDCCIYSKEEDYRIVPKDIMYFDK